MACLIFHPKTLESLLARRKMLPADISHLVTVKEAGMAIENLDQLFALSQLTALPISDYFAAYQQQETACQAQVTLARQGSLYSRIKGDTKQGGYHYRHALTTPLDPGLLVLRTTPLSGRPQAKLNVGHQVKEFVYVLKGKVGVIWRGNAGRERHDELAVGDSIYIDSWIPHAFYAIEPDSQILAVDYQ